MSKKPLDENKTIVRVSFPNPRVKGFGVAYEYSVEAGEVSYRHEGNIREVTLNVDDINELLKKKRVTKDVDIRLEIVYPIK